MKNTVRKDGYRPFKILALKRRRKADLLANGYDEHGQRLPGTPATPAPRAMAATKVVSKSPAKPAKSAKEQAATRSRLQKKYLSLSLSRPQYFAF